MRTRNQTGRLLRVLGLAFGIAIGVGTMIGGGILRTPGSVADRLLEPWLILLFWGLGGLHALLGANVIAEISTAVPKAGGLYVPTRRAFGDFAGLLVGWSDWLTNVAAAAALALVFAEFAALLSRGLSSHTSSIAALVLVVLVALNWLGVREGSALQQAGSALKCLLLLLLVGTIFILVPAAPEVTDEAVAGGAITLASAIVAYQLIYGVFSGWPSPVFFVEEDENALKNIPYTGRQRLDENPYRALSKPYFHLGVLGEVAVMSARLFLNAENILNVRQTRYDPLVLPERAPSGAWTVDVWAPTEGFILNGGVRLRFGGEH